MPNVRFPSSFATGSLLTSTKTATYPTDRIGTDQCGGATNVVPLVSQAFTVQSEGASAITDDPHPLPFQSYLKQQASIGYRRYGLRLPIVNVNSIEDALSVPTNNPCIAPQYETWSPLQIQTAMAMKRLGAEIVPPAASSTVCEASSSGVLSQLRLSLEHPPIVPRTKNVSVEQRTASQLPKKSNNLWQPWLTDEQRVSLSSDLPLAANVLQEGTNSTQEANNVQNARREQSVTEPSYALPPKKRFKFTVAPGSHEGSHCGVLPTLNHASISQAMRTVTPKIVKQEEEAFSSSPAVCPPLHEINNAAPILQDSVTGHSLLLEVEGEIEKISSFYWNDLNAVLNQLGKARPTIEQQIRADVHACLKAEGSALAKRIDDMLWVGVPTDGPARGNGIFAKREIKKFEVLGPYSGKLHRSQASLNKSVEMHGADVYRYLFAVTPERRSIDAFNSGNILSVANTAKLHSTDTPLADNNNTAVVGVGRNLLFLVAKEDISVNQEILIEYGPNYDPMPYRPIIIKKEPTI